MIAFNPSTWPEAENPIVCDKPLARNADTFSIQVPSVIPA